MSFWEWCLFKLSTIHTKSVILLCQSIPSTPTSFICSSTFFFYCWISTTLYPFLLSAVYLGKRIWGTNEAHTGCMENRYYSHSNSWTKWCKERKNSNDAADFIMTFLCTLACQPPDNTFIMLLHLPFHKLLITTHSFTQKQIYLSDISIKGTLWLVSLS